MSTSSEVLKIAATLVCIGAVVLVIYLIVLITRVMKLLEEMRDRLNNKVNPLLDQAKETATNLNHISLKAVQTLDSVSALAQRIEEALGKFSPVSKGQHIAISAARVIATRLAGLSKAAETLRMKDEEGRGKNEDRGTRS
jgi:predicted PurR-regulated permease PerM